jgi:hypothetical protein
MPAHCGGLGIHFTSHTKQCNKKKMTTFAQNPGHDYKWQTALTWLESLLKPQNTANSANCPSVSRTFDEPFEDDAMDMDNEQYEINPMGPDDSPHHNSMKPSQTTPMKPSRMTPCISQWLTKLSQCVDILKRWACNTTPLQYYILGKISLVVQHHSS